MSDALETLTRGYSVDPGRIETELAQFWEGGEDVATRASLMNLVLYYDDPGAADEVSAIIGELTREHACRAIVVAADAASPENRVRAWINAHCHITRAGAKQVCCEQITFHLEGRAREALPNVVFSHLDSDLPLCLWWRGEFDEDLCPRLWTWVDRLLFDSASWADLGAQLDLLHRTAVEPGHRMALCDLNWTRIVYFRQGLAQIFDHPEAASQAGRISRVVIGHNPAMRSTAGLLAGWIAAQLGWTADKAGDVHPPLAGDVLTCVRPGGGRVEIRFEPGDGAAVHRLALEAPGVEVQILRPAGSRFLHAGLALGGRCEIAQMLPAGGESLAEIANEELVRGGRHKLYLKAAALARNAIAHCS